LISRLPCPVSTTRNVLRFPDGRSRSSRWPSHESGARVMDHHSEYPVLVAVPSSFSVILGFMEVGCRVEQMSLANFAGWGRAAGLLLSGMFVLAAALMGDATPLANLVVLGLVFALAGAASASGSPALARRSEDRELLDSGPQADERGLRWNRTTESFRRRVRNGDLARVRRAWPGPGTPSYRAAGSEVDLQAIDGWPGEAGPPGWAVLHPVRRADRGTAGRRAESGAALRQRTVRRNRRPRSAYRYLPAGTGKSP
jgi:hypothetical protein